MRDIKWLANRLKSMNVPEVAWRVQQKAVQKQEYKKYYLLDKPVTDIPLSEEVKSLALDVSRLAINWDNQHTTVFDGLVLLGNYKYSDYKMYWNAGFQTDNMWDENDFSYSISTNQREDIGDIRTNWELNRHFQFACVSKNYYLTGDDKYLDEFRDLFVSWNDHNHFLHGVEWTSAMEVAIRVNSWIYAYAFLKKSFEKYQNQDESILNKLSHGILAMAVYIKSHRAKFSSANNHLIVEMYALGLTGIVFSYQPWINYSIKALTEELPKQNYADGVNKEMSLHYQTFVMEAYGLLWLSMEKNKIKVPSVWKDYLSKMSEFVADSCGEYSEVIIFGDNDEGKILDLSGKKINYYHYVLQIMGDILGGQYTSFKRQETIDWVSMEKTGGMYTSSDIRVYEKGGMVFLRSKDRKVLIAMDCGDLGFASIAAHGHADALSIQVYYEGNPVLVDSGTYNYHVPKKYRDEMRSTKAHNTVYVEDIEQAEMLGPFLWGRRYNVNTIKCTNKEGKVTVQCKINYKGVEHTRIVAFDRNRNLEIIDSIRTKLPDIKPSQIWNINAVDDPVNDNNAFVFQREKIRITSTNAIIYDGYCSYEYNNLEKKKILKIDFDDQIHTHINLL